jgi:hypothetical protein
VSHFQISGNKGFQIKTANGFTVSVQFGPYNYCANRDLPPMKYTPGGGSTPVPKSPDAEVAVFRPDGEFIPMEGMGDTVRGWVTPDDVARLLSWTADLASDTAVEFVPDSLFSK